MQALNVLVGYVVYALLPATGTMMLGTAGWLLGRERIHGWLGLFIPFIGVLALILSLVWIIATSITLYRARAAGSMPAAPPPRNGPDRPKQSQASFPNAGRRELSLMAVARARPISV